MNKAKFVKEISIEDPDTKNDVQLSVYKHEGGGIFAIDSSFLDQCCDDDSYPIIADPFNHTEDVMLVEDNAISNFIGDIDLKQD